MDDDERSEDIISAKIRGASTRDLARQHGLTTREIERIIDAKLDYELDNRQRLRLVKLSVERILSLMQPFYDKAIREKCCASGTLVCKLEERLSLLLGTDAPTTQRVDVYQIEQQQKPSSHERVRSAINAFWDRLPPAQKALRERLANLDAEEALRLLDAAGVGGNGKGNGDGTKDPAVKPPQRQPTDDPS